MRITARHWTAALLAALLVHAGLLAAVLSQPEDEGALADGFGGIEVGLGPAGGAPGGVPAEASDLPEAEIDAAPESASEPVPEETIEAAEVETPEAVEAPVEATALEVPEVTEPMPAEEAVAAVEPAPPVSEPLPAELAEPLPVEEALAAAEPPAPAEPQTAQPAAAPPPEPQEEVQAEAVTPPPPRAKPERPQPKEVQKPPEPPTQTAAKPEPAATEPPPPAPTETVAEEASTTTPSDAQTAAITATPPGDGGKAGTLGLPDAGSGDGGGGVEAAELAYKAQLQAWIEKHKKYPRRARLRNQQGTPLIHFEIDPSGAVLVSGIAESSGYRLLDREAVKTIERADPMPEPPEELRGGSLSFTVPLDFSLK